MNSRFVGDFIGFSFNGVHCSEFGITRVSAGDRYTVGLFADLTNRTQTAIGKIGEYYFGTQISSKPITLNIAFDNMTELQLSKMTSWLNIDYLAPLIFDEYPYKYYMVKIANNVNIDFLPFDSDSKIPTHIYKGEGTIQFIAFDPMAYSNSSYLDQYKDLNKVKYSIDNLPPWFFSAQILPEIDNNNTINQLPKYNYNIYVGGSNESPINIAIKFNSNLRNAEKVSNSINLYSSSIDSINIRLNKLKAKREPLFILVSSKQNERDMLVEQQKSLVLATQESKKTINTLMSEIAILGSLIDKNGIKRQDLKRQLEQSNNILSRLDNELFITNNSLSGLLILNNPSDINLQRIEVLKEEIFKLNNDISAQRLIISNIENDIAGIEITINSDTEKKYNLELQLDDEKINQTQIYNELSIVINTINELEVTLNSIELELQLIDIEISDLNDETNTLNTQVQLLNTRGIAMTGNNLVITRKQDNSSLYKDQIATLELDSELAGKILYINAANHDVYYESNGRRYEYFSKFNGDFLSAIPTGIKSIEEAEFDAGTSLSNTVILTRKLSELERLDFLNKTVVFIEDYKSIHQVSTISNISIDSLTGNSKITLSSGYSLTKGIKNIAILNNFMQIGVNDIRFIDNISFDFPYVYF